jgi:6-pyruvoyltetrahydropterin/6-carboxytetrahydropterin synthase
MGPQTVQSGYSEISLEMTFDAGHRIVGHRGKCARLHGHTYKVHIMVGGRVVEPGFVVDFGDLKELVNVWDHRMLLWDKDPFKVWDSSEEGKHPLTQDAIPGIVRLPFNPTAELMAAHLCNRIYVSFPNVEKVMVELWETPKSMARALR